MANSAIFALDEHRYILITITQFFVKLIFSCFHYGVHFDCFWSCGFNTWVRKLFLFMGFTSNMLTLYGNPCLVCEVMQIIALYILWSLCMCGKWWHLVSWKSTDLLNGEIWCGLSCSSVFLVILLSWFFILLRWFLWICFQLLVFLYSSCLDFLLNHLKRLCPLFFINPNILCFSKFFIILLILAW